MGLKEREAVYYMLLYKYMAQVNPRGAAKGIGHVYKCHYAALERANYILAALDMNLDDSEVAVL